MVPDNNHGAFAAATIRLLSDEDELRSAGERAYQAAQNWNREQVSALKRAIEAN